MAKSVPTVLVKNKKGHVMRINVGDFDSKIHTPAGHLTGKEAPKPSGDLESKVAAAGTFKALGAIADEFELDLPEDIKPLAAAKAHLLSQKLK